MRRHGEDGKLNELHLERLKDKLGTRSMPTGEYLLQGARAESMGELERGFAQMTEMLNLSRLYNATASASLMRRVTSECLRYATTRQTFGRNLLHYPMVVQTLVDMLVDLEGALHLLFYLYYCRGLARLGLANEQQLQHLRILVPLGKLTTGRQAVTFASEGIELHGGNGYIEDWPLSRFLRDAQVLPIWEGTTNILALDTLRSARKEGCGEALLSFVESNCAEPEVLEACRELRLELASLLKEPGQPGTIRWCWRAVHCFQACLLTKSARTERAQRLCEQFLDRHFGHDRTDIRPRRFEHTAKHFGTMLEV
ncbi:MAG: acyl-CoA dehydrogenase family protein [Vulcanimicrobiota bacterium]